MISVDSDVPVPGRTSARKGRSRYPFREMIVGQSFFVAGGNPASLHSMARRATRDMGWGWTARAVTEGGKPGARLWRKE